ncbi:MAG TPA: nucleotidyl transferase AbiEii/AbiGii toxin family protein [Fibrobacteraceae bacterium]|nr:nucleotidyl transferase AbiEii/AbiGii toxin family protein [Fibrobacteraceae bacterium]
MSGDASHDVRVRLARKAREMGADFALVLVRYGVERLLYRLSRSSHADQFILKGSSLFLVWKGQSFRVTRDVDFLGYGEPDAERIRIVFEDVASQHGGDDGLVFLRETVVAEPIRESQEYDGIRVTMVATLGKARIPVQIDIGFGDSVVPGAESVDFPSVIDQPMARLRAYSRYSFVSEKVEAMVKLGIANSRMKDFYDLCLVSRMFEFEWALLHGAVEGTFARRRTPLPVKPPIALTVTFWSDPSKESQWRGFLKKSSPVEQMGALRDVGGEVARFVLPLFGLDAGHEPVRWIPSRGW